MNFNCPCCCKELVLKVEGDSTPSYAELVRQCDWCKEANCVAIQNLDDQDWDRVQIEERGPSIPAVWGRTRKAEEGESK